VHIGLGKETLVEQSGLRVILIRHGETEWARDGRHTGRTDIRLTELGRMQAIVLGDRLRGRTFHRVLSSPLSRAFETCRLAGVAEHAEISEDLMEWDYGAYEGRRTADIREEVPGWFIWRDGVPDGETAFDVGVRADRVIAQALEAGGETVLFAHGHYLRVLTARWLGLPAEDGRLFALAPATSASSVTSGSNASLFAGTTAAISYCPPMYGPSRATWTFERVIPVSEAVTIVQGPRPQGPDLGHDPN